MNNFEHNGFNSNGGKVCSSSLIQHESNSRDVQEDMYYGRRSHLAPVKPSSKPVYDPASLYYDMSGNKLLFIFDQNTFQDTPYFRERPKTRHGTECDVASLQKTFGLLNFIVDEPCNDFTYDEIKNKLKDICEMDHRNTSCVAIAVLTHGTAKGVVCAADKTYLINEVFEALSTKPSLAGKPKLFFIQACRGGNIDQGIQVHIDSHGRSAVTIPTHSDCLKLMGTYMDHLSYRTANGSWLIQALCKVLVENHKTRDILHMMMLVNHDVANNVGRIFRPELINVKQIPEIRFTLTKFIKF